MYLDHKKINPTQIIRLVEKLFNSKNKNVEIKKTEINNLSSNKCDSKGVKEKELSDEVDEDEDYYYKFFNYDNEDLNKLETGELQKRKDAMEKLYSKNAVKQDDKAFVFDIRVNKFFNFKKDFDPDKYEAEWDEEEEEEYY
jgi:hypothetical protein